MSPQAVECDEAAELALIGSWLADPACIVASRVEAGDFGTADRQAVAGAILGLHDARSTVTPATALLALRQHRTESEARRLGVVLAHAAAASDHGAHAEAVYAPRVLSLARARRLYAACAAAQAALSGAAPDPVEVGADLVRACQEAAQSASASLRGITGSYLAEAVGEILGKREDEATDSRLSWGVSELDRAGVFVRPGSFPVVAARPGCGKTTFLRRWAYRVARATSRPVIYLTLEQDPVELVYDEVLSEAGVSDPVGRGLGAEDAERVSLAADWLKSSGVFLPDDFPHRLGPLLTYLHQHIARLRPAAVVVDYLTLIQAPGNSPYDRATITSQRLRSLARTTGCPIVVAAQLNRASAGDRREPELHDLRDSGQIEQDATSVILLHYPYAQATREERRNGQIKEGELFLLVKKNRRGRSFVRVPMDFQGAMKRMLALEGSRAD